MRLSTRSCKKRFASDGSFINDADISAFNPSSPSPKVLEAKWKAMRASLKECMEGRGGAEQLIEAVGFMAVEVRAMLADNTQLKLKLSKQLAKHRRLRQTSGTPAEPD